MVSLIEIFERIAKDAPEPPPTHWVEERPRCSKCRDFEVMMPEDICGHCQKETAQGYQVMSLTGRCANGSELDHGTRYHAVEIASYKAKCGAKPGRRSVGWSREINKAVTCPRCIKKLQFIPTGDSP